MKAIKKEFYEKHIENFKQSSKTVNEYCENEGINCNTFKY